jgi:hypothetical protein
MAKRNAFTIMLPSERTSVIAISKYSSNVQAGLTANTDKFATPSPTVAQLKTATDEMIAADVAGDLVNDASRLVLKQKKKAVLDLLREIAAYVIGVAKGDRYVAALSGFELSKEETSSVPTGEIIVDDVRPSANDGEAVLRLADKGGYTMFILERKLPDDTWVMIGAFQLKTYTIKGLPSGASVVRITGYKGDIPGDSLDIVVKAV